MANDAIKVEVDTSVLERRLTKLKNNINSKKSQRLWPRLASKMANIYQRMYAENWPHVRDNTSDYQEWKRHWGFPTRKLEQTGRLRSHLTDASDLVDGEGTTEKQLTLSTAGVTTSATGPGEGVTPKNVDEFFTIPSGQTPDGEEFIKKSIGVGWFESQPHKLAPFSYPAALSRGFSGGTAWGAGGQTFSVAAMGNFLWTANFITEIESVGASFLADVAKEIWGGGQVNENSNRR